MLGPRCRTNQLLPIDTTPSSSSGFRSRESLRSDRYRETLGSYRDCPRERTDSRSNFSGQFR